MYLNYQRDLFHLNGFHWLCFRKAFTNITSEPWENYNDLNVIFLVWYCLPYSNYHLDYSEVTVKYEIRINPDTVSISYFSHCTSNSRMAVISVLYMNCDLQRDMQHSSGMSGIWAHHSVFFLALALFISTFSNRMQTDAQEN